MSNYVISKENYDGYIFVVGGNSEDIKHFFSVPAFSSEVSIIHVPNPEYSSYNLIYNIVNKINAIAKYGKPIVAVFHLDILIFQEDHNLLDTLLLNDKKVLLITRESPYFKVGEYCICYPCNLQYGIKVPREYTAIEMSALGTIAINFWLKETYDNALAITNYFKPDISDILKPMISDIFDILDG